MPHPGASWGRMPGLRYRPGMSAPTPPPPQAPHGWRRVFLIATGSVSLILGVIGIVLPILPTTPFVLLAAVCFVRAWPSMHRRMAESRLFGPMLRKEDGGRYIPPKTKAYAIAFTWVSIGATVLFAVDVAWLRILLLFIAVGVTTFLLWFPSSPREVRALEQDLED